MSLTGIPVSPGRAAGPVVRTGDPREPAAHTPPTATRPSSGPRPPDLDVEAGRIRPAAELVAGRIADRAALTAGQTRTMLDTTAAMATDPSLLSTAEELVRDKGFPAPRAVWDAAELFLDGLAAAGGPLAERTRDLRDVRDRILAELSGAEPVSLPALDGPAILVARDLAPVDAAALDPDRILAVVTEEGGPTSHTAILTRSLGIPAVVGCTGVLDLTAPALSVNGATGEVAAAESTAVVAAERGPAPEWNGRGITADRVRVPLLANIGSPADAETAAASPAEGVGLFRTEFCYLATESEPSVEDQRAVYRSALAPFHGKPVVVRTLDAGADKPLTFLVPGAEPNPALGLRGLRMMRRGNEELLLRQLDAIVAAADDAGAELSVMAPMVATPGEAAWFAQRARAAGAPRVGLMIEVPAAAVTAKELLGAVDFVSVGTNDLAQYTMAADRDLGTVAGLLDPWQPALLRLIGMVGTAAAQARKPAAVCGEAAADPLLACVLAGLGMASLSMTASGLTAVGAELAKHSYDSCQTAARVSQAAANPYAARLAAVAALD